MVEKTVKSIELKQLATEFDVEWSEVRKKLNQIGLEKYAKLVLTGNQFRIQTHWFGFAIASLVLGRVENVLEIGTRRGDSTIVLAKLFPEATIYTIDIKNPKLRHKFSKVHQQNLTQKNIRIVRVDSFFLPTLDLPELFELVFVDGDHFLPQVAYDIVFSYHHVRSGGFLFMHDHFSPPSDYYDVCKVVDWMATRIKETIFAIPHWAHRYDPVRRTACLMKDKVE